MSQLTPKTNLIFVSATAPIDPYEERKYYYYPDEDLIEKIKKDLNPNNEESDWEWVVEPVVITGRRRAEPELGNDLFAGGGYKCPIN